VLPDAACLIFLPAFYLRLPNPLYVLLLVAPGVLSHLRAAQRDRQTRVIP